MADYYYIRPLSHFTRAVMLKKYLNFLVVTGLVLVMSSHKGHTDPEDGGETETSEKKNNNDTVPALVVSDANPYFDQLNLMSGEQIVSLIDSLLDSDSIPGSLIRDINEYAENRFVKQDYYVNLTTYYDSSQYPANCFYKSWDSKKIYPYKEDIRKEDSTLKLVLVDRDNFCEFVPPMVNVITSTFGWRDGRNHNGLDIDLEVWDPVKAAFDGMVRIARYHPGYGRVVVVRHYNGLETLYAHLHRFKVKPGDVVEAGQIVGLGGSSGHSTGSHLHFEVRFKGKPINPQHIISLDDYSLISDTVFIKKNKWGYSAIPAGVQFHTVKAGDFLYKIAKRYGTTVGKICDMNGIHRNRVLIVGDKLRIGG